MEVSVICSKPSMMEQHVKFTSMLQFWSGLTLLVCTSVSVYSECWINRNCDENMAVQFIVRCYFVSNGIRYGWVPGLMGTHKIWPVSLYYFGSRSLHIFSGHASFSRSQTEDLLSNCFLFSNFRASTLSNQVTYMKNVQ